MYLHGAGVTVVCMHISISLLSVDVVRCMYVVLPCDGSDSTVYAVPTWSMAYIR